MRFISISGFDGDKRIGLFIWEIIKKEIGEEKRLDWVC